MHPHTSARSMISNTEKGVFEMLLRKYSKRPIRIMYFEDSVCSSCLETELRLKKLQLENGNAISVKYRMDDALEEK